MMLVMAAHGVGAGTVRRGARFSSVTVAASPADFPSQGSNPVNSIVLINKQTTERMTSGGHFIILIERHFFSLSLR